MEGNWAKDMEKYFQKVEFLVSEDDLHIEWQTGSNLTFITLFLQPLCYDYATTLTLNLLTESEIIQGIRLEYINCPQVT